MEDGVVLLSDREDLSEEMSMELNYKTLRILEKAAERMECLTPEQIKRVIEHLYKMERSDLNAGPQIPNAEECSVDELVSRFACGMGMTTEEKRGYIMNQITRRLAEKLLEDGYIRIKEEQTQAGNLKIEARVKVIRFAGGDRYVHL